MLAPGCRSAIPMGEMKKNFLLMLLIAIAAGLAGCAGATIGPVDHECHGNPQRSWGSGCEDYP
jgi:hypothetical protein